MDIITYAVLKKRIQESKLTPQEKQEIIDEAVQEAVDEIVGIETPEDLDTLKEIADWIAHDETGTRQILLDIQDLKEHKVSCEFVNVAPRDPEHNVIYIMQDAEGDFVEYFYNEDVDNLVPLGKDFAQALEDFEQYAEETYLKKADAPTPASDEDIDDLFNF